MKNKPNRLFMIRRIMQHEWKLLRAEKALVLIGLVLAVAVGYALFNGGSWRAERAADVRSIALRADEGLAVERAAVVAREEGSGNPSSPRHFATLPPGPLADFTLGQSDLYPYQARVSAWPRLDTIFRRYQLASPVSLLAGRFDLAFVMIYLLPLVIIALTFNMLSGEKEGGTLALALAQAIDLRTLTAGKLLLRLAVVLGATFLLCLAGFLVSGPGGGARVGRFLMWSAVVAVYALFWFSLAVAVGARGRRSETNAATLVCLWLLLVLILPGLLNVAVRSFQPVPARLEYLSVMRTASSEAARESAELLATYYHEHPELAAAGEQGGFLPRYYAQQRKVETKLLPILEDLEARLAQQQAMVERWSFLSPAVLVQETLNEIAGSSLARQQRYVGEARQHLRAWQDFLAPFVFRGQMLSAADFDALPRFDFQEEPLARLTARTMTSLAGLVLPALVLGVWGWRRLARFPLVGN